jgi:prepilin-type processing-associated H-X9-DG protein
MMKTKITSTKRDLLVALGCVVFLLLNIGAIGSGGRRRAKDLVCLSNLLKWGTIFQTYTNNNNGYFYSGVVGTPGYWWIADLEEHYQSYKQNPLWFCPMAKKPTIDEYGVSSPTSNVFNAWGIYHNPGMFFADGVAGSYGLNGYVLDISGGTFEGGVPASAGWRTPDVPGASNVPVFLDALRHDLWPLETQGPANYEFKSWSGNHMARCCINRHNGAINCLFMDFSARKIGLKELWTLKWHRNFDTEGPWTKAGGVQPFDWPQWMRNFKEY